MFNLTLESFKHCYIHFYQIFSRVTCNNRKCLLCTWGCFLLRSQIFDQEQGYWTRVTFSFYHKFLKIVVCFLLCGTAVDITTDLQWSEDSLLVKRSLIKESLMPFNREKYSFTPRSKNSSYRSHQNCISNDWSGPLNTNGFLKHGFWQTGVKPTGNLYIWSTSVILRTLRSNLSIPNILLCPQSKW